MIISETNFIIISYLEPQNAVKVEWKADSSLMGVEEFKAQINLEKEAFVQYKPSFVLGQTQAMAYTISPEEQNWHNELIMPTFASIGLKKLAVVVSNDIFAQVSIQQALEEGETTEQNGFKTRYFENETDALTWFQKD
ncbi:MAG: hypothetical protein EAZ55_08040 [Cytophagales bacterium]|nr:MAG: hypothetical protein EAZ55_08040 [Cytophagales bacterium]